MIGRSLSLVLALALAPAACGGTTFQSGDEPDGGSGGTSGGSGGSANAGRGSRTGGASSSTGGTSFGAGGRLGSGGALGSGGRFGTGGTAPGGMFGAGGTPGAGGANTDCPRLFKFRIVSGGPAFCLGAPGSCGGSWLTILDPSGQEVVRDIGCGTADCATCTMGPCPPPFCPISSPLPVEGAEQEWDGTVWTSGGSCGAGQSCASRGCGDTGNYGARFCAYALQGGVGDPLDCEQYASNTPTCVDIPFTWPPTTDVVIGVLDPTR